MCHCYYVRRTDCYTRWFYVQASNNGSDQVALHTSNRKHKTPYFKLLFIYKKKKNSAPLTSHLSHHLIFPLTARVVGAPQMISQPGSSIFPCSPSSSGIWRTPGLSIPWCCFPTSSSVCLVFFPLSLCLARWVGPDLMNWRHDNTTAVCVSLQWSGGQHM